MLNKAGCRFTCCSVGGDVGGDDGGDVGGDVGGVGGVGVQDIRGDKGVCDVGALVPAMKKRSATS